MATARIDDLTIAYELVGDGDGEPWVITPGGRFSKDTPGVRELAERLAAGARAREAREEREEGRLEEDAHGHLPNGEADVIER